MLVNNICTYVEIVCVTSRQQAGAAQFIFRAVQPLWTPARHVHVLPKLLPTNGSAFTRHSHTPWLAVRCSWRWWWPLRRIWWADDVVAFAVDVDCVAAAAVAAAAGGDYVHDVAVP